MKNKKKYIDLEMRAGRKLRDKRAYVMRFMRALEAVSPGRYSLCTMNLTASVEDKRTGLTAVDFSDNPFRHGTADI